MLTAREVASLLGLPEWRVRRLSKSGAIRFYRFTPRSMRFDPADVAAYKESLQPKRPMLSTSEARKLVTILRRAGMPTDHLAPETLAASEQRYRNLRRAPWANKAAIEAIYAEARRLTKETGTPHHVDHIIPLQGPFVSGLHVETNLRVVTRTENLRKRNKVEP